MIARMLCAILALVLIAGASITSVAAEKPEFPVYPEVRPGRAFAFPADHGSHPEFRTEWWYITGWLDTDGGRSAGFQVTFFRTRPQTDQRDPGAFAPRQIVFAHAALSDPAVGHLLHDQRAARAGFGIAEAAVNNADIVLGGWSLKRQPDGRFHTKVSGKDFALDLTFEPTQSVLLEGANGYSRKGPLPSQASYYYSLPHLKVSGGIKQGNRELRVTGTAWLDREWSSTLLDPRAVGWDWVGFNLDGGGALMAFQIRDAAGGTLWAGGTFRAANGAAVSVAPEDVHFAVQRRWRSPRTGADYPVEQTLTIRLPEGERIWHIRPLLDDQELDSRGAAGPVYWEGAAQIEGGRGYLELTGYFQPVRM